MEDTSTTTAQSSRSIGGNATFAAAASATHALLRIGAGLLFMQHGAQKLFGWLGGDQIESLFSLMGLAGVLEFFGGLLIVLGLLTQPLALILAVEMVVAFFMVHAPQGGFPIQNGGELPLLFALVFAFLAANGPGPWSVDRQLRRRSTGEPSRRV